MYVWLYYRKFPWSWRGRRGCIRRCFWRKSRPRLPRIAVSKNALLFIQLCNFSHLWLCSSSKYLYSVCPLTGPDGLNNFTVAQVGRYLLVWFSKLNKTTCQLYLFSRKNAACPVEYKHEIRRRQVIDRVFAYLHCFG